MSITYTDIFCGAGGSSLGLTAAGMELRLAANHWDRAIETHAANFPDADHLCADVNNYDMRRLPRTDVLWASPICTEISPAGGRRRGAGHGQLALVEQHGPVAAAAFDRTRATAYDVIRATEVHRYAAVLVENVVEFATDWELFAWWLDGMVKLGYQHRIVCVSSAHVGGPGNVHAPQWRDRIYIVFVRNGIPMPDIEPRPAAWCVTCDEVVAARQVWKRTDRPRIGKYGRQYVYRCPNTACRHQLVEPFVLPAAAAIDWSDLGQRIGDRDRPLAEATVRRIRAGLEQFARPYTVPAGGTWRDGPTTVDEPMPARTARETDGLVCPPLTVAVGGNTWERPGSDYVRAWPADRRPLNARTGTPGEALVCPPLLVNTNHDDDRPYPADGRPLPTRTVKIGDGVVVPPFVAMLRANNRPTGIDEPLAAVTTGRNHALAVPPGVIYVKNYGGNARPQDMARPVSHPLGTITGRDHHALVVPYYRTGRAKPTIVPLDTLTGRDRFALVQPGEQQIAVEDCRFRMLQPREHLRAQRFPDSYIVHGNRGEQTMQAGNAVSANVAQWLGQQIAAVLGGTT